MPKTWTFLAGMTGLTLIAPLVIGIAAAEQSGAQQSEQAKAQNRVTAAREQRQQEQARENAAVTTFKDSGGREFRVPTSDRVHVLTRGQDIAWNPPAAAPTFSGCPAAISGTYPGCVLPPRTRPPEKAWHDPGWFSPAWADDTQARFEGGYLLRLGAANAPAADGTESGNGVVGYVPLLGGGLAVGQPWPGSYKPVPLPAYVTRYYGLGGEGAWRYYDRTIYRMKPDGSTISGVAAILLGAPIRIGQTMPSGHDVYNLPAAWRDQYRDGPEALYRYSDGYIYQLDPASRRVRAAIELLS